MYFEQFPLIYHGYTGSTGEEVLVKLRDITRNVRVRRDVLANITLYETYDLVEGETPEIVAEKVYGSSEYNWVVMLLNNKYDYILDFPLSQDNFSQFIKDKYNAGSENNIHHYEDTRGFVVNSTQAGAKGITNIEYETRINEAKGSINLINPLLLSVLLENYESIMSV